MLRLQQTDIRILEDAVQTANSAATLGAETLEEMQRQNDRLDQIDGGITKVEQEVKISAVYLRRVSRRMVKDKICLSLSLIAVLLLIVILIYKFTVPSKVTIPTQLLPKSTGDWIFWDSE